MKNTQDLLHGNIRRELIALTIPLVIGNILQQFYNTIDSFIVGRYVGTEAFAGIGVAGSIMNLFIFILNGGCNGMSIIFAELYGQKNYEKLRKESFLSLSAGGGFTIVLSIISLLVLYPVLGLIRTPLDVEPYVVVYLRIIFIGLPATFLYNWCSAVLRAALTRGAVQLLMGNPSETVIKNAVLYMNVVSVFYILNFIGNAGVGFFRGIGKISVPVIGSTLHISIRVVLSYLLIGRMGLEAVAFATGIGWISVVLYQIVVYRKVRKQEFC